MKYSFNVYKTMVDNHLFWVAESKVLKGCVAQGETIEEALQILKQNEETWLYAAKKYNMEIPENPVEKESKCSGTLSIRIGKELHAKLAEFAKVDGTSINQAVQTAISYYLGAIGVSVGAIEIEKQYGSLSTRLAVERLCKLAEQQSDEHEKLSTQIENIDKSDKYINRFGLKGREDIWNQ